MNARRFKRQSLKRGTSANGNTVLCPGLWVDAENRLHADLPRLAAYMGVPYSEANADIIEEAIEEAVQRQWGERLPKIYVVKTPQ